MIYVDGQRSFFIFNTRYLLMWNNHERFIKAIINICLVKLRQIVIFLTIINTKFPQLCSS